MMTQQQAMAYIAQIPPQDRTAAAEVMLDFWMQNKRDQVQEQKDLFIAKRTKTLLNDEDYREDLILTLAESKAGQDLIYGLLKHSDDLRKVAKEIAQSEADVKWGSQ